jgi:hypothetical protein
MQNKYNCKNIFEGAMQPEDIVSSEMDLVESIVSFVFIKGWSMVNSSKTFALLPFCESPSKFASATLFINLQFGMQ